ncbi:MAG: hypothetical protein U9R46_05460, partial [Bacteroidota bacterium]|nr:hypothetical protein [Bacteroidota bacterium]
ALTDASAETFAKLPKEKQEEFLTAYYDVNKGIGYTLARTNIHEGLEGLAGIHKHADLPLGGLCQFFKDRFISLRQSQIRIGGGSVYCDRFAKITERRCGRHFFGLTKTYSGHQKNGGGKDGFHNMVFNEYSNKCTC